MYNFMLNVFYAVVLYLIIALLWQGGEKLFYGQITHRYIDDVVAVILAISILANIKKLL